MHGLILHSREMNKFFDISRTLNQEKMSLFCLRTSLSPYKIFTIGSPSQLYSWHGLQKTKQLLHIYNPYLYKYSKNVVLSLCGPFQKRFVVNH